MTEAQETKVQETKAQEYADELVVLAVNSGEDEKTVKQFADENECTFLIAPDTDLKIGSLYPGVMQGIPIRCS